MVIYTRCASKSMAKLKSLFDIHDSWGRKIGTPTYIHYIDTYMTRLQELLLLRVCVLCISPECDVICTDLCMYTYSRANHVKRANLHNTHTC